MMLYRLGACLLAVGLVAAPARAADYEKYLLDDTDALLTVNVKQALESPAYVKELKKQAEGLLKMEQAQQILKDTGFDPLKDLDRVTFAMGHSSHRTEQKNNSFRTQTGPLIILEGRFDADKLNSRAEALAKDFPFLKSEKIGKTTVWEIAAGGDTLYLAAIDKTTVIGTPFKDHMTDALDKAAGKKKTQLKSKAMTALLAKMDAKATATWAASGEMISDTHVQAVNMNGQEVRKVEYKTLADNGIESILGSLKVGDDLKGETTLIAKDADKAKEMTSAIEGGLKQGIERVSKVAEEHKELVPLVDAMKSIKVTNKDKTITFQAQGSAKAIEAFVLASFIRR
jgi:hypothetical protein